MKKCKITVLKREYYEDLAKQYAPMPNFPPCPLMKEGDVFITTGPFGNMCPEGFCDMAWQAISIQASTLAGGGKVFGYDDIHIACCPDGIRPVVFRLEAIDDGEPHFFDKMTAMSAEMQNKKTD